MGALRYTLDEIERRVIDGPLSLVIMKNPNRGTLRRVAESVQSTRQPLDPSRFNFCKVPAQEVLAVFDPEEQRIDRRIVDQWNLDTHLVLVNVSPIEPGHVLLVPSVFRLQPQALTRNALAIAAAFGRSVGGADFRVGFNSLGANASVNHLHFHGFSVSNTPALERAARRRATRHLDVLEGYPARGIVARVNGGRDEEALDALWRAVAWLQARDIAHNLVASPCGKDIFLVPRLPSWGQKDESRVNIAYCELMGNFIGMDDEMYAGLDEATAVALMEEVSAPEEHILGMLSTDDAPLPVLKSARTFTCGVAARGRSLSLDTLWDAVGPA